MSHFAEIKTNKSKLPLYNIFKVNIKMSLKNKIVIIWQKYGKLILGEFYMKRKYIISFLISISILIAMSVIIFIFINNIGTLINKNTFRSLEEITKQDVARLENIINEHIRILNSIVKQIEEENNISAEKIFSIYNNIPGNEQFSRMAIMYEDGKTVTSDGKVVDLLEDKDEFLSGQEVKVSKSRQSKVNNEEINIYSKMSKIGEKKVAILLVVDTSEYEKRFIQSIYSGNGYEYIISSNGEIIANSGNEPNGNDIYKELKKFFYDDKNVETKVMNIKENIQNISNGQEVFKKEDHSYFLIYQKLNINDWYLAIVTSGSIVAEELNKILEATLIASGFILIITFIISLYVILSYLEKKEQLYNLAYIDPITKLGNHYFFIENGEKLLKQNLINYIIILDIDKFKSFNKQYGHNVGDKLLYEIGSRLKKEINNNQIVCRISNDVFACILMEKDSIEKTAERINSSLSKIQFDNFEFLIKISMGIYKITGKESSIKEILDKTLIANRMSKEDYSRLFTMYDEKIEEKLNREHYIESIMEEGIEKNEFEIYYQPKIEAVNEMVIGAEALVRWKHNGKYIFPNEFIPIFEKNRFIIKLDLYIFDKVCKDLTEWKEKYKRMPLISINVSKEHFDSYNFIEQYMNILKKYNLSAKDIELEITESATLKENIDIVEIMRNIKEKGFNISLDDFGTGYSSFNMLQNMPLDVLKIDKSFIDQIQTNRKENVVQYIIYIAKKMKLKTIAEGVETKEQLEYLKSINCDYIQGYYFSKPIPKEEFENKYVK